jgi:hypothetical protein
MRDFYIYKYREKEYYPILYGCSINPIENNRYYYIEYITEDNLNEYLTMLYYIFYDNYVYEYNSYYIDYLYIVKHIQSLDIDIEDIDNIEDVSVKIFLYVIKDVNYNDLEIKHYCNQFKKDYIEKRIVTVKEKRLDIFKEYLKEQKSIEDLKHFYYLIESNINTYNLYKYDIDDRDFVSIFINI